MDYKVFSYHLQGKRWVLHGVDILHDIETSVDCWQVVLKFDKSIGAKSKMFLRGTKCIGYRRISSDGQNKLVWELIEE